MRGLPQMSTQTETFKPDYIVTPGDILEETLEAKGIKKREFAERCGRTAKMISEIIAGKAAITPETALQFERVLGVSASLWSNLESKYRLRLAENDEQERLQKHIKILDNFPFMSELINRGFIEQLETSSNKTEKLSKLLTFFGVGNVDALDTRLDTTVSYRKSHVYKSDRYAVNAWLRCGEIKAAEIDTEIYNADKFKDNLRLIKKFIKEPVDTAINKTIEKCAEAGVALVLMPELKGTYLSGAARWLNKDKALIQLSARGKSDDLLWFTFFHEAGHILLHGKKELFVDEENQVIDQQEKEADEFAQNSLIAKEKWEEFTNWMDWSEVSIRNFANKIDVSPGIVAGRLQHQEPDALKSYQQNNLKIWFEWDESKTKLIEKNNRSKKGK